MRPDTFAPTTSERATSFSAACLAALSQHRREDRARDGEYDRDRHRRADARRRRACEGPGVSVDVRLCQQRARRRPLARIAVLFHNGIVRVHRRLELAHNGLGRTLVAALLLPHARGHEVVGVVHPPCQPPAGCIIKPNGSIDGASWVRQQLPEMLRAARTRQHVRQLREYGDPRLLPSSGVWCAGMFEYLLGSIGERESVQCPPHSGSPCSHGYRSRGFGRGHPVFYTVGEKLQD